MTTYQFFVIDSFGEISQTASEVECADDKVAIGAALHFLDLEAIEIWNRNRFVTRLEPRSERQYFH